MVSPALAKDRPLAEATFRYLDRNADGHIDADELRRAAPSVRERMAQGGISSNQRMNKDAFSAAMATVEVIRRESEAKESKVVSRASSKLPAEYQHFDKNNDGQIGLYEWDRTKLHEFRELDLNGDGFLTPRELARHSVPAR